MGSRRAFAHVVVVFTATCVLSTAVAAPAVEPLPPPAPHARAVPDLAQLHHAVEADALVLPAVERLETRRNAGIGIMAGSIGLGAAAIFLGAIATSPQPQGIHSAYQEEHTPNVGLIAGGAALLVLGGLLGYSLFPGAADLQRPIDTWNQRHAAAPLRLGPAEPEAPVTDD